MGRSNKNVIGILKVPILKCSPSLKVMIQLVTSLEQKGFKAYRILSVPSAHMQNDARDIPQFWELKKMKQPWDFPSSVLFSQMCFKKQEFFCVTLSNVCKHIGVRLSAWTFVYKPWNWEWSSHIMWLICSSALFVELKLIIFTCGFVLGTLLPFSE